jgi:two-component system, NtrC family, response regulator AtoC
MESMVERVTNPISGRVLVIDDDASLRFALEAVLGDAGLSVVSSPSGAAGLQTFEANGADAVLTDLAMPEMDGLEVLTRVRGLDPGVPVIMLTAHGSERVAVAAMKAGAYDYLPKPFDPDEIVLAVRRAIETRSLRLQNALLRTESALGRAIVASSPAMRRVLETVARVAPKDVTVLFTGPSGAGKDVVATALHAHSSRADKPFIRFNAAAIPIELAEAELFGHTKGAFTGAQGAKLGYFQQAAGGTLFIDEVGELPMAIQAKLLRALQSGEVQPVGGRPEKVDARVVAATNRDLAAEAKAGRFREDLFYRLNVVPIRVPPLRDRPEDIEPLLHAFVRQYVERYGMTQVQLEPDLIDAMKAHPWPGNVRGSWRWPPTNACRWRSGVLWPSRGRPARRRARGSRKAIPARTSRCARASRRSSAPSSPSSSAPPRTTRARPPGASASRGRRWSRSSTSTRSSDGRGGPTVKSDDTRRKRDRCRGSHGAGEAGRTRPPRPARRLQRHGAR